MREERLCVFCKHFAMQFGGPDWSEVTPGPISSIDCWKNRFEVDAQELELEEYRELILKAESCVDYTEVEDDS